MEHNELLLGLVSVVDKGQELIPHKDYEIKQDGEKFYLVKKKKEYPKTYEECCRVLEILSLGNGTDGYKWEILSTFQNLIIYRDAYWKIAGEEMGLGKSWEPDWNIRGYYAIARSYGNVVKTSNYNCDLTFVFPTEEMQDTFYENFKELIEECKELL